MNKEILELILDGTLCREPRSLSHIVALYPKTLIKNIFVLPAKTVLKDEDGNDVKICNYSQRPLPSNILDNVEATKMLNKLAGRFHHHFICPIGKTEYDLGDIAKNIKDMNDRGDSSLRTGNGMEYNLIPLTLYGVPVRRIRTSFLTNTPIVYTRFIINTLELSIVDRLIIEACSMEEFNENKITKILRDSQLVSNAVNTLLLEDVVNPLRVPAPEAIFTHAEAPIDVTESISDNFSENGTL